MWNNILQQLGRWCTYHSICNSQCYVIPNDRRLPRQVPGGHVAGIMPPSFSLWFVWACWQEPPWDPVWWEEGLLISTWSSGWDEPWCDTGCSQNIKSCALRSAAAAQAGWEVWVYWEMERRLLEQSTPLLSSSNDAIRYGTLFKKLLKYIIWGPWLY